MRSAGDMTRLEASRKGEPEGPNAGDLGEVGEVGEDVVVEAVDRRRRRDSCWVWSRMYFCKRKVCLVC